MRDEARDVTERNRPPATVETPPPADSATSPHPPVDNAGQSSGGRAVESMDASPTASIGETPATVVLPDASSPDFRQFKHDVANTAHVLKLVGQMLSKPQPNAEILQSIRDGLRDELENLKRFVVTFDELFRIDSAGSTAISESDESPHAG